MHPVSRSRKQRQMNNRVITIDIDPDNWITLNMDLINKMSEDHSIDILEITFSGEVIFYWKIKYDRKTNIFWNHGFQSTRITKKKLEQASKPCTVYLTRFFPGNN